MRHKPRFLIDLKRPYGRLIEKTKRINLAQPRIIRVPLFSFLKFSTATVAFLYLIFGSALAPMQNGQLSLAAQSQEEREQLEKQLAELEKQMDQYQTTIEQYRSQGSTLQGEIKTLDAKISKLNLQIKSINVTLSKLKGDIETNQVQIVKTESEIDKSKTLLSGSIQKIYEQENTGLLEVLLKKPTLSDFFTDVNDLLDVQEGLRVTLEKVTGLRLDLLDQKEQLAIKRNDAEALRDYQLSQKQTVNSTKQEKDNLLKTTKGQESKYQELLKQTQKTAAQIRSRIFELLGGGELSFEEALKFAQFAEQATGVRAAMILAVLDKESALGQNVGRCQYNKNPYYPDRASNPTTMHPTRDIPIFESLTASLGLNAQATLVSCPIPRDGAYGGAMGPAQFIPSTWKLYADRIGDLTGNNPPSPWRHQDAFTGTALYLKDAGAYKGASLSIERQAAAKYYAGGRWRSYLWTYGERVVSQAEKFQKDIDFLSS